MLHEYRAKSIKSCLGSRRIVFVGDSTIRQVFWATASKMSLEGAEAEIAKTGNHSDIAFHHAGVTIEFVWDPFINSSRLYNELVAYKNEVVQSESRKEDRGESASLILVGGGLWYAHQVAVNPLRHFKDAIDEVVGIMSSASAAIPTTGAAKAFSKKVGSSNFLLLAPLQNPWYESLSPSRAATITREKVDAMNDYLQQLSAFQDVDVVWSYSLMTWRQKSAYNEDGLHVVDRVATRKADIILNLRCNAETAAKDNQRYPFNKTCCSNYRHPGWVQWLGLLAGIILFPGLYLINTKSWVTICRRTPFARRWTSRSRTQPEQPTPMKTRLDAFTVLALALCYCFYADRTQVLNKVQKHYSSEEFTKLSMMVLILGVLSIRRSVGSAPRNPRLTETQVAPDQPFLARDQTDEWKGWMQFIILIYHYTDASKVLWIYQIVRLLVASYLFMTGFGHTVFFLKKKDYSFRRVAAVLVRLNLLSCVLPYMMRTDYLFYYFAPLVTFWFLVVYTTLRLGQSYNDRFFLLYGKILLSAVLVYAAMNVHGPLEFVFALLKYTCRIHWNVKEWRFRVMLDIFIVYVGMICAVIFIHFTSSRGSGGIAAYAQAHPQMIRTGLIICSSIALPTFLILAQRFPSKFVHNRWHPYISNLPILAFVILRNAHHHLRNFHSSIFAWLGRCSLETFILQFHIWLAGDTKGLLSLGVFGPVGAGKWIEFCILTSVFVWISWRVASATGIITEWILKGNELEGVGRGEEQDEGGTRMVERETEMALLQGGRRSPDPTSDSLSWTTYHPARLWKKDLRVRIGMLLFLMWILNIVRLLAQIQLCETG